MFLFRCPRSTNDKIETVCHLLLLVIAAQRKERKNGFNTKHSTHFIYSIHLFVLFRKIVSTFPHGHKDKRAMWQHISTTTRIYIQHITVLSHHLIENTRKRAHYKNDITQNFAHFEVISGNTFSIIFTAVQRFALSPHSKKDIYMHTKNQIIVDFWSYQIIQVIM